MFNPPADVYRRGGVGAAAGQQIVSPSSSRQQQRGAGDEYGQQQGQQQQGGGYGFHIPAGAASRQQQDANPFHDGQMSAREQARLSAAEEEQRAVAEALAAHSPAAVHVPAHYDPSISSVARSSYQRYDAASGPQRARAPPSTVFSSGEKFAGASVTKSDYAGRGGAPARLARPEQRSTVGGEEGRDFRSENADNYKAHGYARRPAAQPAHTMHVSQEPFSGVSTSKEDYPRWSARPAEPVRPYGSSVGAHAAPDDRDFATEAGSKFNPKGFVARQPAIPFSSHVFSNDEDRSFATEHGSHFTQRAAEPPCPSDALIRQQAQAAARGSTHTKVVGGHFLYEKDQRTGRYQPLSPQ